MLCDSLWRAVCFTAAARRYLSSSEIAWRMRLKLTDFVQRATDSTHNNQDHRRGEDRSQETHITRSSAAGNQDHLPQCITGLVNEQESQRDHRPNMLVPRVPHHHRPLSLSVTLIVNQSSGAEVLAQELIGTCAQM